MKKFSRVLLVLIILALIVLVYKYSIEKPNEVMEAGVVINEIAWMGTTENYNDEWIELHNSSDRDINLSGWSLEAIDGTPSIELSGVIPAKGYFLLERSQDDTIPEVLADLIYSGSISNTGEVLELKDENGNIVDKVDKWYAGDNDSKATMERRGSGRKGNKRTSWITATTKYDLGYGTPLNSSFTPSYDSTEKDGNENNSAESGENLNNVSNEPGAINVYFNKSALTQYAIQGNEANYNVNLENRLLERINNAKISIDMATYEINLPRIIDALIQKAAEGVEVRVLADAKEYDESNYDERYGLMRIYLEMLIRGKDGRIGTEDDIHVFSDSPIFAVEDSEIRNKYGLKAGPEDIPYVTINIENSEQSGYIIAYGEIQTDGGYFSPNNQMHNKFVIIDDTWVWTGSWNFTITGLYGSEENMAKGVLGGNQQHAVEINSQDLAGIYEVEFNEMWGNSDLIPNPKLSNQHSRKKDNTSHMVNVGGRKVGVYFSPGDNALEKMVGLIKNEANYNTYFEIFAWSDQALLNELKFKWENSYSDLNGELTGFDVKGVFDSGYWDQWWSASVDITGRTASRESNGNANIRWANPAPVFPDKEERKLHAKTMLIDADTDSNPTVIVGSTNWSNNGNKVNDENLLIIFDKEVVNQFLQEFYARYQTAGGRIPH